MLFLAALDKFTREEMLDLNVSYQALGLWEVAWEQTVGGLARWLGWQDYRPLEDKIKAVREELAEVTDAGLRRRLLKAIKEMAGVSPTEEDPETISREALKVAAQHLKIGATGLPLPELELRVCEANVKKLLEGLEKKLKKLSPEEEDRLRKYLEELLERMSAGDREALRQAIGAEELSAQALLAVLRTGGLALGTVAALNAAGFGLFLAAATGAKALTLLFGVALPFGFYAGMSSVLAALTGPLGVALGLGIAGLVWRGQSSSYSAQMLCYFITAMHYRLTRDGDTPGGMGAEAGE
jgi:hypothetical protein